MKLTVAWAEYTYKYICHVMSYQNPIFSFLIVDFFDGMGNMCDKQTRIEGTREVLSCVIINYISGRIVSKLIGKSIFQLIGGERIRFCRTLSETTLSIELKRDLTSKATKHQITLH